MKKLLALVLSLCLVVGLTACGGSTDTNTPASSGDQSGENAAEETQQPEVDPAVAELLDDFDTSADGIVLGFSNSYNGNSYRQKEEALFYELADQLKAMGVLKDYIVTESNSDNATQASQIQSLILKGVDAIIVVPALLPRSTAPEEAWVLVFPA